MSSSPSQTLTPPPHFRLDHLTGEDGETQCPYFTFDQPLEQSQADDNEYRLIQLTNQLQALVIHGPAKDTVQSAAALSVNVGNFADPKSLQGLAHFCEHLLFMGTEKYPEENDYGVYLNRHGGSSNAYTDYNNTNFHFQINSDHFEGALDRFAQFFIAPLFNEDCTERELKAVDSEHSRNRQNDMWRAFQVERSLADPDHPFSNFGTGDINTLKTVPEREGINVREELLKFHERYYSANLMRLVVYGRESLEQLTAWVVTKFSSVVNRNAPWPHYDTLPWKKEHMMRNIRVESVQSNRHFSVDFPLARDFKPNYLCRPALYYSNLIGYEGEGSLLQYLKKKGWVVSLSAGGTAHDIFGFDMFSVFTQLTPQGLEHLDDIVVALFEYLAMLRREGPQKDYFDFIQRMSEVEFRFHSKDQPMETCVYMATRMHRRWIQPQHYLADSVIREYRPQELLDFLDYLVPDNCTTTLIAKGLNLENPSVESHYQTEYEVQPYSSALVERLHKIEVVNAALHPPPVNTWAPSDLTVHTMTRDPPVEEPTLLHAQGLCRLWHKLDDTFRLPRCSVHVRLRSPVAYTTPSHDVHLELLATLWEDHLNTLLYDVHCAGLTASISTDRHGILLHLQGFNDKLPILLYTLLEELIKFQPQADSFRVFKDALVQGYEVATYSTAANLAMLDQMWVRRPREWSTDECLEALRPVTLESLTAFHGDVVRRLTAEILAVGNVTETTARNIQQKVQDILHAHSALEEERFPFRCIMLPTGHRFVMQRRHPNPKERNGGIVVSCIMGHSHNFIQRGHLALLESILKEPFFDELRTKETLGYVVRCQSFLEYSGLMMMNFIIQSERNPMYLEFRILHFLRKMLNTLEGMSLEDFENHKRSLINNKKEHPKSITQEASRYWQCINNSTWEFDRRQTDINNIRPITKEALVHYYRTFLLPTSPMFTKLSTQVYPHQLLDQPNLPGPIYSFKGEPQPQDLPEVYPQSVALLALQAYLARQGISLSAEQLTLALQDADIKNDQNPLRIMEWVGKLWDQYHKAPQDDGSQLVTTTANREEALKRIETENILPSFFHSSVDLLPKRSELSANGDGVAADLTQLCSLPPTHLPYDEYVLPMVDGNQLVKQPYEFKKCLGLSPDVQPFVKRVPKDSRSPKPSPRS
ncbi:metalloprotease [Dispira simplex]|nr:metalloprotease [Dispira simplex]